MIFDWEKIRNSEWLESVVLMKLWSVYVDTGDPVPVEIGIVWDTDSYPDSYTDRFWREAWIYGNFGGREDDTATVIKMNMKRKDGDIWEVSISKDIINEKGYYEERDFTVKITDVSQIDEIFWDAVKERMEEIAKDEKTFIKFVKEEVFWSSPSLKLFKTKKDAVSYGNGIKITYGFLKELESEMADGEDAYDWLMRIYS